MKLDYNPVELRVITYNIRHAEGLDGKVRPEAVAAELRPLHADVIALQEVDRYKWRSGLHDQARYFARELGMNYVFAPSIRSGLSQYGIALLSRYPLESPRQYRLSGGREPRSLLTAELHLSGRKITVATTHLGVAAAERQQQLPQLQYILKGVPEPLLLMGDFNSISPGMPKLGLIRLKFPEVTSTVLKGGEIDHIFVSSDLAYEAPVATVPSRASDHLPVVASLVMKPAREP
ncbi:endonuclease/exonuclease/phosphatase family protein [Paenibacillus allorhizosphaerae]|uniref:endonuclease/exonuclease/phosphatase family protein n=1 Tax=Paenibacillus allorhizosphaerae TaxID=2849866 RepID=UPI001C407859|nr:endonuclease/exonuclease/phosphatase family protein [Paenibacillus allorhizosphaerae]